MARCTILSSELSSDDCIRRVGFARCHAWEVYKRPSCVCAIDFRRAHTACAEWPPVPGLDRDTHQPGARATFCHPTFNAARAAAGTVLSTTPLRGSPAVFAAGRRYYELHNLAQ